MTAEFVRFPGPGRFDAKQFKTADPSAGVRVGVEWGGRR